MFHLSPSLYSLLPSVQLQNGSSLVDQEPVKAVADQVCSYRSSCSHVSRA